MTANRFILTCCCLLFAVSAPALHAQEESADLKQAREAYQQEVEFATHPIRNRYLSRLEMLKRSLGARGDARGALAIQDEIDKVKNSIGTPSERLARFAGVWRVTYSNGTHPLYAIKSDGSVTWGDDLPKYTPRGSGKITTMGDDYTLEFEEHLSLFRLSLVGDRLAMDVFTPKGAYPTGTPERVIGVRVGDRKP